MNIEFPRRIDSIITQHLYQSTLRSSKLIPFQKVITFQQQLQIIPARRIKLLAHVHTSCTNKFPLHDKLIPLTRLPIEPCLNRLGKRLPFLICHGSDTSRDSSGLRTSFRPFQSNESHVLVGKISKPLDLIRAEEQSDQSRMNDQVSGSFDVHDSGFVNFT